MKVVVIGAAIYGSRNAALQVLLLDPVVTDMAAAEACLDEMLPLQAPYLSRFAHPDAAN